MKDHRVLWLLVILVMQRPRAVCQAQGARAPRVAVRLCHLLVLCHPVALLLLLLLLFLHRQPQVTKLLQWCNAEPLAAFAC